ncbi:MAG: hypothetical protein IPJ13_26540 [Saprospiraceae bacterium]|nr:hypothetical protein [Saprospiraceae bacterium]
MASEILICPYCGKHEGSSIHLKPVEYLFGSFKTQQEILQIENVTRIYNSYCKCGQVFYSAIKSRHWSKCYSCMNAFLTNIPEDMIIVGIFDNESKIPSNLIFDGMFKYTCDSSLSNSLFNGYYNGPPHTNIVVVKLKYFQSKISNNLSMEI